MFEIIIFGVILLAISYWAVLWLMGRRADVLHGEYVEAGAQADEPARPIFPQPPAQPEKPVVAERPVRADITKPVRAAAPEQPAFRPERLASLFNSIKQDLNQPVRK